MWVLGHNLGLSAAILVNRHDQNEELKKTKLLIARMLKSVKPFRSYEQSKTEIETHLFPLQVAHLHRRALYNVPMSHIYGSRVTANYPIFPRIEASKSKFSIVQTLFAVGSCRV